MYFVIEYRSVLSMFVVYFAGAGLVYHWAMICLTRYRIYLPCLVYFTGPGATLCQWRTTTAENKPFESDMNYIVNKTRHNKPASMSRCLSDNALDVPQPSLVHRLYGVYCINYQLKAFTLYLYPVNVYPTTYFILNLVFSQALVICQTISPSDFLAQGGILFGVWKYFQLYHYAKMEMSLCRNIRHWLRGMMARWQHPVQQMTMLSSKWHHFCLSVSVLNLNKTLWWAVLYFDSLLSLLFLLFFP